MLGGVSYAEFAIAVGSPPAPSKSLIICGKLEIGEAYGNIGDIFESA